MKTILVIGSNGLVGQKLLELLQGKAKIIACSKSSDKIVNDWEYTFELIDIRNKLQLEYIISVYRPNSIINTAAITQVDYCEENKPECWETNVEAVSYLSDLALKYDSHLVHFSTDFVFDGNAGPYKEEDELNPLSYYGLSKQRSEGIVREKLENSAVIRTILVYGFHKSMTRSNLVLWVKNSLEEGKSINVITDQFRAPTLVDDLAETTIKIALEKKKGLFHLSSMEVFSIYELAMQVAEFYKLEKKLIKPITSIELNEKARRPKRTGFILNKAISELAYCPKSFKEGIEIMDLQMKNL